MTEERKIGDSYARLDLGFKPNGKRWNPHIAYQLDYPERLLDLMANGLTYVEVGRELGASLSMMRRWKKDFPEFEAAWVHGAELAEAWYQTQARRLIVNYREPNGPIETLDTKQLIYVLKSRFKQYDNPPPITMNLAAGADLSQAKELIDEYTAKLHKDTI